MLGTFPFPTAIYTLHGGNKWEGIKEINGKELRLDGELKAGDRAPWSAMAVGAATASGGDGGARA